MSFSALLNQLADVYDPGTATASALGGAVYAPTVVESSVPVRVCAVGGNERAMRGSQGVLVTHRIYRQPATAITLTEKHYFKIGAVTYQIKFVNNPHNLNAMQICECEEIRDGGS